MPKRIVCNECLAFNSTSQTCRLSHKIFEHTTFFNGKKFILFKPIENCVKPKSVKEYSKFFHNQYFKD